jgi:hypothetical protein
MIDDEPEVETGEPEGAQRGAPVFDAADDPDTGFKPILRREKNGRFVKKDLREPRMTSFEWRKMQLDPESKYNKLLQKRTKRAGRVFILATEEDFEPLPDNMLRRRFQLRRFEERVWRRSNDYIAPEDEFEVLVHPPNEHTSPEEICAVIRNCPEWRVEEMQKWHDGRYMWVFMPGPLYYWIQTKPARRRNLWKMIEKAAQAPGFEAGIDTPLPELKGAVTFILEPPTVLFGQARVQQQLQEERQRLQRPRSTASARAKALKAKASKADAFALKVGPRVNDMRKAGFNWSVIARELMARGEKTATGRFKWTTEQVQNVEKRFSEITAALTAKLGGR